MSSTPSSVLNNDGNLESIMCPVISADFSWDTWDVDEREANQIVEEAKRRAGNVMTDEEKTRLQRQMENDEKIKELARTISKRNNFMAERVRRYIRYSQEVEENIRKLTQDMSQEMDAVRRAAIEMKIQLVKDEFTKKMTTYREVLHSDLCTFFSFAEVSRFEECIEELCKAT